MLSQTRCFGSLVGMLDTSGGEIRAEQTACLLGQEKQGARVPLSLSRTYS
jgi:hypothetical protein